MYAITRMCSMQCQIQQKLISLLRVVTTQVPVHWLKVKFTAFKHASLQLWILIPDASNLQPT